MNQTERLYHIDKLLRANRCVAVNRFLEELGISIATFKRDLEHLRNHLNAPIVWDRGCRGYRLEAPARTGPRYELPGIWFNANEIHALLTIEHLLQHLEPGVLHPFFSAFRERLAAILEQPESALREIERRVFIHPRFQRLTSPKHFETVVQALLFRQRLRLTHSSRFKQETSDRVVSPQRLIHYREVWYLVAWCHLREAVRTFALDNVLAAEILDDPAVEVEAGELDALLDAGYGIWSGETLNWARLRFHPASARWAASETWHRDQRARFEADGSYLLEIPYSQDEELIMDILRYGPGCTVLEPPELRAKVCERLEQARHNYG